MSNASKTILGIDLGGTKTAVALFDVDSMQVLDSVVTPTHADRTFAHVQEDLLKLIASMRRQDTIGIGIGVPGLIDHAAGTILVTPNIPGAEGCQLAKWLQEKTGLKTVLENDAQCFAYAEALVGAGQGERVVVGITLGTGVGGGIVIDGTVFRGAHGSAGEFGHMLLRPGQPPFDAEDKRGDVEQFLSGKAMGRRCEAASDPTDYLSGEVCSFMHPDLFREVAWLIVNITHALDPSIVVFGGSAGRALKPHFAAIGNELRKWMIPHVPQPTLAIGLLENAAVRGAAMLALVQLHGTGRPAGR